MNCICVDKDSRDDPRFRRERPVEGGRRHVLNGRRNASVEHRKVYVIRSIARYAVYRFDVRLSRVEGQVAPQVGKLLITGYRPWLNFPGAWNLWG